MTTNNPVTVVRMFRGERLALTAFKLGPQPEFQWSADASRALKLSAGEAVHVMRRAQPYTGSDQVLAIDSDGSAIDAAKIN
jgi:hypothetical protein